MSQEAYETFSSVGFDPKSPGATALAQQVYDAEFNDEAKRYLEVLSIPLQQMGKTLLTQIVKGAVRRTLIKLGVNTEAAEAALIAARTSLILLRNAVTSRSLVGGAIAVADLFQTIPAAYTEVEAVVTDVMEALEGNTAEEVVTEVTALLLRGAGEELGVVAAETLAAAAGAEAAGLAVAAVLGATVGALLGPVGMIVSGGILLTDILDAIADSRDAKTQFRYADYTNLPEQDSWYEAYYIKFKHLSGRRTFNGPAVTFGSDKPKTYAQRREEQRIQGRINEEGEDLDVKRWYMGYQIHKRNAYRPIWRDLENAYNDFLAKWKLWVLKSKAPYVWWSWGSYDQVDGTQAILPMRDPVVYAELRKIYVKWRDGGQVPSRREITHDEFRASRGAMKEWTKTGVPVEVTAEGWKEFQWTEGAQTTYSVAHGDTGAGVESEADIADIVANHFTASAGGMLPKLFNHIASGLVAANVDMDGTDDHEGSSIAALGHTEALELLESLPPDAGFVGQCLQMCAAAYDPTLLADVTIVEGNVPNAPLPSFTSTAVYKITDDKIFIAVQGTRSDLSGGLKDMSTNLKWWQPAIGPDYQDASAAAKVHGGFKLYASSLAQSLADAIEPHWRHKTLVFTGHSLGGAAAQLLSLHNVFRSMRYNRRPIRVVTFGSPKVGNASFARDMTVASWLSLERYETSGDPICRIPPKLFEQSDWEHGGVARILIADGSWRTAIGTGHLRNPPMWSMQEHRLETYQDRIREMKKYMNRLHPFLDPGLLDFLKRSNASPNVLDAASSLRDSVVNMNWTNLGHDQEVSQQWFDEATLKLILQARLKHPTWSETDHELAKQLLQSYFMADMHHHKDHRAARYKHGHLPNAHAASGGDSGVWSRQQMWAAFEPTRKRKR